MVVRKFGSDRETICSLRSFSEVTQARSEQRTDFPSLLPSGVAIHFPARTIPSHSLLLNFDSRVSDSRHPRDRTANTRIPAETSRNNSTLPSPSLMRQSQRSHSRNFQPASQMESKKRIDHPDEAIDSEAEYPDDGGNDHLLSTINAST